MLRFGNAESSFSRARLGVSLMPERSNCGERYDSLHAFVAKMKRLGRPRNSKPIPTPKVVWKDRPQDLVSS
jgi:hypothetical protein